MFMGGGQNTAALWYPIRMSSPIRQDKMGGECSTYWTGKPYLY